MNREAGTTLVELLIASAIMLTASAAVFRLVANATATSPRWNDAADLHQRARMALDAVYRTITPAGAGLAGAPLPAIEPRRRFMFAASPSAVTIRFVPERGARTTLAADLAPGATAAAIASHTGCASGVVACGFTGDSQAAVFDGAGWHLLAVESIAPLALRVADRVPGRTATFAAGSSIVEILETSLYFDRVSRTLRQEGPGAGDFPVVDNVVDVGFEYVGEGSAPIALQALADGPLCGSGSLAYDCDLGRIRSVRVRITIAHARPDTPALTAIADISPRNVQR